MYKYKNRLIPETVGISALLHVVLYVLFHLTYLFDSAVLEYVYSILKDVVDFLLPPAIALLILYRFRGGRVGMRFVEGALICATRLLYLIPYFYIYNFELGLDTTEAILLSLPLSLLSMSGTYVFVMLLFAAGLLYARGAGASSKKAASVKDGLCELFTEGGAFDFNARGTVLVFILSLASFAVSLYSPIYDTVGFFAAYGDSYEMTEILSIILDFALRVLMLVVAHLVLAKERCLLSRAADAPQNNDKESE